MTKPWMRIGDILMIFKKKIRILEFHLNVFTVLIDFGRWPRCVMRTFFKGYS